MGDATRAMDRWIDDDNNSEVRAITDSTREAMGCSEWIREKQPQTFSAFSGHGASGSTTESYAGAG